MKIFVVGIGPGDPEFLTPRAKEVIRESDTIIGYDLYISLLGELIKDKKIISNGMKKEIERIKMAKEEAEKGKTVSVVCSGDPGIYAMAGLVYEVLENSQVEIEVIPGITAASSAAAILGAPLIHDFSVISLSDLLTPWEKIEKRLLLASEADFVICIYNPKSKKRVEHLTKAVELMKKYKSPGTPSGFVKNAGRKDEFYKICTLEELVNEDIDMFTTIIVGNSQTKIINGKLVTPRGYKGL